jgi:glycosyl transferase family 1
MRLFQNVGIYRNYRGRLRAVTAGLATFGDRMRAFLDDRYGSAHILQPIQQGRPEAFLAIGDDPRSQRRWALENGLGKGASLEDILLAQLESHRAEIFYNMEPVTYGDAFLKRLPGCVKRTIAWRAAPSPRHDFFGHDLVVSNFPGILRSYAEGGAKTALFHPGHDPELDLQAKREQRPIDILFVGGYTQYHRQRAELLQAVARLGERYKIVFHLDRSRAVRLAETPLGLLGPLSRLRRPPPIRAVARPPLFGRALHEALGSAKIVLNGAIDMAGPERGNVRCFEALGAGCLMVSDEGIYPAGFEPGQTFLSYQNAADASAALRDALEGWGDSARIAAQGHRMVAARYSKERQWESFEALV